jgi:N-acetylmuramoyl-L-alanine amidase
MHQLLYATGSPTLSQSRTATLAQTYCHKSNQQQLTEDPMKKRSNLKFVDRPSPNFNDRKGQSVQFLVIHDTAMPTTEDALKRLTDPTTEVSAHYVVDEQGTIYRLVAEENRAWHAGVSYWDGKTDLNTTAIGIEIANPGEAPYPQAQMDAVIALSRDIVARHKIRPSYVVAHSDIAPDRKQDPGEQFDWKGLAAFNLGVLPAPTQGDYDKSKSWGAKEVTQGLAKLGYRPEAPRFELNVLLTAFQRHFHEEVFQTPDQVGKVDVETNARLANLIRRKAISDGMLKRRSQTSR